MVGGVWYLWLPLEGELGVGPCPPPGPLLVVVQHQGGGRLHLQTPKPCCCCTLLLLVVVVLRPPWWWLEEEGPHLHQRPAACLWRWGGCCEPHPHAPPVHHVH